MLTSNLKLLEAKNPLLAFKVGMEAFPFVETEVTYVYGVGEVPFDGHRLIFFEDNMERLHRFLHLKTATRLLEDPRVHFFTTETESIKKALWETALLPYQIIDLKGEGFLLFKEELEFLREGISLSIWDVKDRGRRVLSNIMQNMELSSLDGLALKMENIPAIICGAGPSLQEGREWVRDQKGKALILACGSAIELIEEADAGVCLDPMQPQEGYEKPLFYQNRIRHEFLKKVKGKRLNMGYGHALGVESLFLGEDRLFDTGWNAGNFGVAIAHSLGCFPIITVGIDHEGGYAPGVDREKGSLDFKMGRAWMKDQGVISKEGISFSEEVILNFEAPPLKLQFSQEGWNQSWNRSLSLVEEFLKNPNPVCEVELEEEVVYQYHLAPLWLIWKYLTGDRWSFFALVLQEGF
ncbi:MAG: DUF115 domain-containing protein [Simkaniaceae bacterium]|nr:DUF115 domain-containing protein [Simkaniaceae bacterium]